TNAWNQASEMADKHSNSIFVRLANDGDKVVGVFCGDPLPREVVWTGEKYLDADTDEAKPFLKKGRHASLRVAINLYVPAEKAMKVYEMGTTVFKDLLKVRGKYGLDKWAFEIERHGAKNYSKTTYTLLPEHKLDDATQQAIAQLELHDLDKVTRRSDDEGDDGDQSTGDASEPASNECIAPVVLDRMMPRLKLLPREAVDRFLAALKVQRVKEIRAADQAAALELLAELEAEQSPAQEIDPFA
ncbi:hypothetical protein, partial [Haliangium sp.]|uniref:hypothetical protein n=2 Tax=Haliangium sp. TaxID=2663208 RepID=UPI003D0BC8D2